MPTATQIMTFLRSAEPEDIREGAYLAGTQRLTEAVPLLIAHIADPRRGVQEAADHALRKIGGTAVVHAAIPLLYSEDAPIRSLGMDLLRQCGKDSVEPLIALLNSPDPDIRIFSADILGSAKQPMCLSELCKVLLEDKEVNVRYQAAISIGNIGKPETASILIKALDDEEWVQFAVIEALTKLHAESSIGPMLDALDKSTDLVASSIIEAIGNMGSIKAVPLLLKRLEKAPAPLCNIIVKAIISILGEDSIHLLGNKEVSRFHQYLLNALQDEDTSIQDAAIKGLAAIGDEQASARIIELAAMLDPDENIERLDMMLTAIARMGKTSALENNIRSHNESTTQIALAALLRMHISNEEKVDLLKRQFWESPRNIQRIIIFALATLAEPQDQAFFIDILKRHTDGNVLRGALLFLQQKGTPPTAEHLVIDLLTHPYDDVQEAALDACIALRSPAIIQHLYNNMLTSQDAEQRKMAVYALATIDPSRYTSELNTALEDTSPKVRRTALQMLCTADALTDEQITAIISHCSDKDKEMRIAVIEAMSTLPMERAQPVLLAGLADNDPWVRVRSIEKIAQRKDIWGVEKLVALFDTETNHLVLIKLIEALGEVGNEVAFRALLEQLDNPDPDILQAAATAIETIRNQTGGEHA